MKVGQFSMNTDDYGTMIVQEFGNGFIRIGFAQSPKEGKAIVEAINHLVETINTSRNGERERLLAAVTDAIEGCFDG